jgi:hypothetical protein
VCVFEDWKGPHRLEVSFPVNWCRVPVRCGDPGSTLSSYICPNKKF